MLLNHADSCLVLVDVQDKLAPLVCESNALIQRCEWLLKLAQALNVPSIMNMQYPQGLGQTVEPLKNYSFHTVVEKTQFSCCGAPNFIDALNTLNKKQIILMGIETHVCVLQTAIELKALGYDVFVVVDAVSARHMLDHQYGLKRMKKAGCHLISAEMIFFEWLRDAQHPQFKALSRAFF